MTTPWTYEIKDKGHAGLAVDIFDGRMRVCAVPPSTSRSRAQAEAIGERLCNLPVLEATNNLFNKAQDRATALWPARAAP